MLIADSQVHIWGANTPERPWPPGRNAPHRPVPFSADDLLREMDAAGVQRCIIAPPPWEGERNDLGLAAAQRHPDRLAVMGLLDIDAPAARGQLLTWRRPALGMLGLRINLKTQGNAEDDRLWGEAEAGGVPIMMVLSAAQMPIVGKAAQRHPGLRLVIDHLGIERGLRDEAAFEHLNHVLDLARYPNIAVKASSLPSYTSDAYPFRFLHPHIRRVYDAFGPRRMFWGSDLTRMPCPYRQAVTLFTEELSWLTDEDKQWIMGRALCEWLGWQL